jgi:hypothetical protein
LKGHDTFCGGVSRRFLGLTPGHTYRVSARLNTLETKREGNWSFSFHAAYNPASGEDLTPAQMAGSAALPDQSTGPTAGQIAKYDAKATTVGVWFERASDTAGSGKVIGDITLPAEGVSSLTVWFRLEGKEVTNAAVGIDSVTIEDLSKREAQK